MESLFGPASDPGVDTPEAMRCSLMPHQRIGLKWLLDHERGDRKGGVLADDMGLGKTIQALALMLENRPPEGSIYKTTLIVAPMTLFEQWRREIRTKIKPGHRLSVYILHGTSKKNISVRQLLGHDVVLTNYEHLAAEFKALNTGTISEALLLLHPRVHFYRVILDECHLIKNRQAFAAKAAFSLKAKYRLAISGTPIMNRLDEMFSLMCFLRIPDFMQWPYFNMHISLPLRKKNAFPEERRNAQRKLNDFRNEMMLIRSKTDLMNGEPIVDIPQCIYHMRPCFPRRDEFDRYHRLRSATEKEIENYLQVADSNYAHLLVRLLRLRQACCHFDLVSGGQPNDDEEQDSDADSDSDSDADVDVEEDPTPSASESQRAARAKKKARARAPRTEEFYRELGARYHMPSTKITKILEILETIRDTRPGEKALVFSSFTSFLDLLVLALRRAGFARRRVGRYDGTMSAADKDAAVAEFTAPGGGITILLLGLKSGNAGLNLTRANHVVFAEPHWNPFLELQAVDRAHRLGQTRTVYVYKLFVWNTIEQDILGMQEKKKLIVGAMMGTGVEGTGLTGEELLSLLRRSN